jgi:YgiT-type zinc finger domain-containing protein
VGFPEKKRKEAMKARTYNMGPCTECGGKIKRDSIEQEFERNGITVRLTGMAAWVCSQCGEIYFLPGGGDKVAEAAHALFALAGAEKQYKGRLAAQVCRS